MNDDDEPNEEVRGDQLPEDLDVTAYVGPYVFPDIKRRRIAGTIYLVLGAIVGWAAVASDNPSVSGSWKSRIAASKVFSC